MIGSTQAKLLSLFALGTSTFACSTEAPDDETSVSDTAALTATEGDSADEDARPPHPHRPPQEAFDACKEREVGSSCSVTFHDENIDGTCRAGREDDGLVCMPNHPPRPPQAAFDACKEKTAGDECTVTFSDTSLQGTCHEPPEGTELVCAPKGMRPPPRGERNAHDMEETLDRLEREIGGS